MSVDEGRARANVSQRRIEVRHAESSKGVPRSGFEWWFDENSVDLTVVGQAASTGRCTRLAGKIKESTAFSNDPTIAVVLHSTQYMMIKVKHRPYPRY